MTSYRCTDGMYWDRAQHTCLQCEGKYPIHAGYEFTENCGWSDEQQQVGSPYSPCTDGTFNDRSQLKCQKCHTCTTPQFIACSATSDTICCKQGEHVFNGSCVSQPLQTTVITTLPETSMTTDSSTSLSLTSSLTSSPSSGQNLPHASNLIGIYVCLGLLSVLSLVCLIFVIKRRKTHQLNEEFHKLNGISRESLSKKAINRYETDTSISYNIIRETENDHISGSVFLLAEVQGAPLKTVLNNLDVLEELVLILDPDTTGAKNTRHLAAQCSFSFAWINYAYSMKDHKSPLVAVLEGVVTKNPDWTVGHLAELLTAIGRNDAVEILAKLPAGVEE